MSTTPPWPALPSRVGLALVLAVGAACCAGSEPPGESAGTVEAPAPESGEETAALSALPNQIEVTIYFLAADGEMLAPERRRIFRTATVTDRARQAVQALLDGPEGSLMRSVPPGAQLHEIFIASDGTAFVDLGPEFRFGLEAGSSDAVFAIYSIVNTLASNFDEIQRVKILIDGDEAEDVGGHLDLSRPILPEMSLVDRH